MTRFFDRGHKHFRCFLHRSESILVIRAMRLRFLMLAAGSCLGWIAEARATTLTDVFLALQVSAGSSTVTFPFVTGTLSWSTGEFTAGDYTISNITEEFAGPGFPDVTDPAVFRLTGIDSITCTICADPLEIDFIAAALPDSGSDFVYSVTVGMDGSLGPGNDVPAELLLLFPDGSIFDQAPTLNSSAAFNQTTFFGSADFSSSGGPAVQGSFFLGCGCTNLAPGQVFSAPDSISVTFATPEPGTGTLLTAALIMGLPWALRRLRRTRSGARPFERAPRGPV